MCFLHMQNCRLPDFCNAIRVKCCTNADRICIFINCLLRYIVLFVPLILFADAVVGLLIRMSLYLICLQGKYIKMLISSLTTYERVDSVRITYVTYRESYL